MLKRKRNQKLQERGNSNRIFEIRYWFCPLKKDYKKTRSAIEILLGYLPQQLTELQISGLVRKTMVELGTNSMKHVGKVMFAFCQVA